MKEKVVIYCSNGYGERVMLALDEEKYEIVALSDSNKELWGWQLHGYTVVSPDELQSINYDMLIISTSEFASQIIENLVNKYGVLQNKIVVFEPRDKGIAWQEERVIQLKRCLLQLKERNIYGNIAELGVWKGEFAKIMNRYLPERKLYLFDTFEGFRADKDTVQAGDESAFKDTSVELVLSKMKNADNCIVKKGWFPETAGDVSDEFALVSLDADLYEPIYAGLEFFYPKLVKGGYIFIHDYNNFHYTGVKEAVHLFSEKYNVPFIPLVDRSFSAIIAK